MDFWEALAELHKERERLTIVIRNLEALLEGKEVGPVSRRGRKGMSAEERTQVSERMRRYWAEKRGESA
jgi:hypothetical protein